METRQMTRLLFKISLLLLILLLVGLVFSGCRAGLGAVPRGWSGAAIVDDTLFIGSMEGKLVAVNTTDHSRLWAAPLETVESGGGFGCAPASTAVAIYGSPSVSRDLVYVGGYNGIIYAFGRDEAREEPRWVYPRQGHIGGPIIGGTIVDQGKLYFASANGQVYALEAANGHKEWEFEIGDKIWSTPAINGDTLYIGSFDKKLYAIDATDGSKKWEFETEGAIVSTPLVHDNIVYVGSFDRYLYAIDAADGDLKWKFMAENWFWAKPVVYNNTVYAGCLDGKVYALNAKSGEKLVEFDLGGSESVLGIRDKPIPVSSSPVLVDNSIIVATEDGVVYALDTEDNRQRQLVDLEEKVHAPLAASQEKVYIHTASDALYEVDAMSGAMRELDIK